MVEQEKAADPFHDSEAEDIYDLYNAVNGAVRDGLLDVSRLDEYSPEEAEAFNVPRLREIWLHTKSGCPECARIVRTLTLIRVKLRQGAEGDAEQETDAGDTNVSDAIS